MMARCLAALVLLLTLPPPSAAQSIASASPRLAAVLSDFAAPEAGQGIAVDAQHFYAVDNRTIAKYDKKTGALVTRWQGAANGPLSHLDGAVVREGRLYAAHSNYPEWPMTSSIEIWDAVTLEHVGTHSFGVNWGSLTWADFHDGYWWLTFANYDRPIGPGGTPYGTTAATQLIKFTADFRMLQAWVLPKALLSRFGDMSNSGGSWGPDGFLYLTGHDAAELYRTRLPVAGSTLELVSVLPLDIRGQGIAWDRARPGILYGIVRATAQERAAGLTHRVRSFRIID